jgi:hypothetical protein
MIFETNKTTALSDVAISGNHEDLTNIPVKRIWFGEGTFYDRGIIKVTSDDGNFQLNHLNQIIVSFGDNIYYTSDISSSEFNIVIDDYDSISILNWNPDIINNVITFIYDGNLQVFIPNSWSIATSEKFGQVKLSDDYTNNDSYTALSTIGLQSFKDSLPTVATTGNYSDLLNKPDFNTSFTDAFNNLTISTIHQSAVNYHTKSNTIANALNELYNKSVIQKTFSPYTKYNSSNKVTIDLYRRGYIVHCNIVSFSTFPEYSSALIEYTIPELFRPAFQIYLPCVCTSNNKSYGTMRWIIGTDGSISFDSNTATVWTERHASTTWVTDQSFSL